MVPFQQFTLNGFRTKEEEQSKKQLSQLNESLNDFVIGININVRAIGKGILESQTNGCYNNFEKILDGENSACQIQVIENNIDYKITKAVDNAVKTGKNCMHDACLTAMNEIVIPKAQMAVRPINKSSVQGPSSVVQKHDRRDFTGKTKNTPLMLASSRLDLNVDQYRNDETRNIENNEDGDFPALRPNYDRRAQVHHNGLNASYIGGKSFTSSGKIYDLQNTGDLYHINVFYLRLQKTEYHGIFQCILENL